MACDHKNCLYWHKDKCYYLNQTIGGENCLNFVDGDTFIEEQFKMFLVRCQEMKGDLKDE